MATKTFSGNSSYRLEATATRSGKTITVTVKVTKTAGTGYWTADGQPYSVVIDGTTYSGDWSYDFRGSTPKTLTVTTRSKTTSPGTRSWSVTVQMGSGIGSASLSGSVTVPYDPPAAPTIGTPVRVSDTRQTVHWTRNASVDGRYQSQQVQRRQFSGAGGTWGAWVGVVDIATDYTNVGAMSAADSGTVANRAYQYRVKASNSTDVAYSGASKTVFTSPGAPSALSAQKTAGGGIKLTLTRTVAFTGHEHKIEYSINGGVSWSALTTLGSMATEYTWNSPPAGETLVFRARARVNDVDAIGHGLTSGWRESNSVALAAPPNPPSSLSPNGSAFDAGEARRFTWRHNPVDTSEQRRKQIRYRPVGGAWVESTAYDSTTQLWDVAADTFTNGVTYEWQVRTWGIHADPSPWSNTATVTFSTPPVATITAPPSTLPASLVTMEWTYYDEETTTQSAWQAELLRDGTVLEARSGSGGATSTTFTERLDDATDYMVRVRVRDGHNLWSLWDQVTFATGFPAPTKPRATASWVTETGTVILNIENAPGEGAVPAVSNDVYRSVDGETWELIATGVAVDVLFSDAEAPVGREVFYRVVAWSDLPSSRESDIITIITPDDCGYWSVGDIVVRLYGDVDEPPRMNLTHGIASKTLHYYAGRRLPMEVAGTAVSRTGSVSFTTLEPGEIDIVRQLAYLPAPHLFRHPHSGSVYASIGPVSEEHDIDEMYRVSVEITEVEQ